MFINDLLDRDFKIYVKISFISISLLKSLYMILSYTLILPTSQLQTQPVMTSQIRSVRIFNTGLLFFVLIL